MRKFLFPVVLILIFFIGGINEARATHIMGVDLTYECIAPGQYRLHLQVFRDCHGILPGSTFTISYSSVQCGVSSSVDVQQVGPPQDITPVCAQNPSTACGGGGAYGVQKYTYEGIMNLPVGCGNDWVIGWGPTCCRNGAITDLSNPLNESIYIADCLDNTQSPCVSSPVFLNNPIPFFCVGVPVNYNHGVVDVAGDSLVFTNVCCLNGPGSSVGYTSPFTCAQPFATTAGAPLVVNPVNGNINFTPSGQQIGVMAVRVDAYRNGSIVSCVTRDMQFTIIPCTGVPPTASGFGGAGGSYSITIPACADTCLKIFSADVGGATVVMNWDNGIPGGTFDTLSAAGSPDPTGTFCWAPTSADTGFHTFTVTVTNNSCPITGSNTYAYNVHVVPSNDPGVVAWPDTLVCAGQPVTIHANVPGGNPTGYAWSDGTNSWSTQNVTVTPASTTQYYVTAYFADGCSKTGTVLVQLRPTVPNIGINPASITLCSVSPVNITVSSTVANPTFNWTPTAGLSCTNCANPVASPTTSTTYCVFVTSPGLCPSNTVCSQITFSAPPPPQACSVIYATTNGNGNGTQANPTNLAGALALAQCNNGLIKLATGTYNIDTAITNITSYTTIEGGFDPVTWVKTSTPGLTTISRSALNVEGPANAQRIVAVYMNSQSYFHFQDLTFTSANAPANAAGPGISNYIFYVSNCTNYSFVRCQILPGNGGAGATGTSVVTQGPAGSPGANGSNGDEDNDPVNAPGGAGGGGGGTLPGTAGISGVNGSFGGAGGTSADAYSGGGGGGGGAGGYASNGVAGTGGNSGGVNGGGGVAGANGGNTGNPGSNGGNGVPGVSGAIGTTGATGPAGTFTGGFYVPGAAGGVGGTGYGGQGGSGGGGGGGQNCSFPCIVIPGTGDGAGGGGGGGGGGPGGNGGLGGGCSIGVYLFNNGGAGVFTNDDIVPGTGGFGVGGTGGPGGNGGSPGLGSQYQVSLGEIGGGGDGGKGGNGGQGGPGGPGATGPALQYHLDGGTAPTSTDVSFNLAGQPAITVANINCTFRTVNFTSAASGNWDFDVVSAPQTATGTAVSTTYSTAGRKNITYNANIYTGFYNIPINATSYIPNITTTAHQYNMDTFILCQGSSANFSAVIPAADTFAWDFGGAVVPNTYWGPNFQNINGLVFNTVGVFKIKARISTACCGSSPWDSIYLIVDQNPNLAVVGLNAVCPGDSVTLTASGCANYSWSPATGLNTTTGPVVIAKPPTTITYLIRGSSLYGYCVANTQHTVTVNPPPVLSFTTNPATCGGNGSVTVNTTPAGTYTYQWNDPAHQTTTTASALPPGAYIVTVTDPSSGCTVSSGAALSAGTGLQAYIDSSQNASCSGYCDGTARVRGIGATGVYTYRWSNTATSRLITALCAGSYTVTITDANTCTATASVVVSQPSPMAINFLDTVNATCPNKNNGSAYANASGGTGPFQYLWNDPNLQDSAHAVHLYPGTYTVVVVDQHGCVDSAHVPITSSPPIIADTTNVIDVSCFGLSDGAISLKVSGGIYPYTYSWQQLAGVTDSFPQSIAAGSYTAYITDAQGCTDTLKNIPVNQPLQLAAVAVTDSVKCFGGATGGVQINVTGGTTPYQYSIDGVTFQPASNFTGLTATTYTATVKDAHGCTITQPFTVYQPNPLVATLAGTTDDKCFGDNTGTATITIAGGTPIYTAVLGAQTLTASPFTFTGLAASTYTVNVTDANACTTTVPVTINQPQRLTLQLVATVPATCFGQSNGGLTVAAQGGTQPYTYALNGGTAQASPVFSGILGGLEIVAVIDANLCIDTLHINVPQPAQTTFLDTNVVDVVCFGQSNGSIKMIVTGSGGPWTYAWNTGSVDSFIVNLPAGTYTVTVVDAHNCTAVGIGAIPVTQPPLLAATDVVKNDSCFGTASGCITVTATGGSPAYTYNWSVAGAGAQLCNLVAGSYSVTVSDTHACADTLSNIVISQPMVLAVTDTFKNVSCPGKSDGSVTALTTGGTMAYTYAWSNGSGNVNPDGGLPKGTYDVTVTDAQNCTASVEQVIIELPGIILGAVTHNITCPPLTNGSVELSVTTNNPPASYVWSNGQHSQNIFLVGDGTYSVTITDANNCVKDSSFTIVTDSALVIVVAPHDTTIDLGHNVDITVATNGVGGNIASILWMPPGGLNCSDCVSPVAAPIQTMQYVATVVSDSGCVATDTANIIVIPIYDIFIPNVFTPNGDGNNDYFEVFGNKEIWKEFSVKVFDRIGEKVFDSNDMNFKWDGIFKGKYMMPAVFVYEIHLTYINNHTEKLYKGSVTLVR